MNLWTLQGGRFQVDSFGEWIRAARTLRATLGTDAQALIESAERRAPDLRLRERTWASTTTQRLGIDLHMDGLEHIDPDESYIVVALHESFADALALLALGMDLRFAMREELATWPLLGRYVTASNQLITDPERPRAALRTLLRDAPHILASGESLVIFAQGTVLGIEMGFHEGAFHLAKRFDVRVLPVVIAGGHRVWEHPFSPRLRFDQPMYCRVLPAITITNPTEQTIALQRTMKADALAQTIAPVRSYQPEIDGTWPGYHFTIDPDYPQTAAHVARLQARL